MKKFTFCPKCDDTNLGDRWVKGRKLQQFCRICLWKDESRDPDIRPVEFTKEICATQFCSWCYELFDKYGHILVHSRAYNTKEALLVELKKEIESYNKSEDVAPVTAIIWPPTVTVLGEIYKG